jgi:hypothetical protein
MTTTDAISKIQPTLDKYNRKARGNSMPNPVKRYAASQVEAIEKVTAKAQDFGSTLESEWTTGGKVMMIWRAPTGHRVLVTIGRDGSYYGSKLSEGTQMKANQSEAGLPARPPKPRSHSLTKTANCAARSTWKSR